MSDKTIGYVASDDKNAFNKKEFGFEVLPPMIVPGHFIIYKPIKPLDKDDILVRSFIGAMNKPGFYKEAQSNGYIKYLKSCGIDFEWVYDEEIGKRIRKVVINEKSYSALCQWLVEIDYSDKKPYLYLTPAIQSSICFYNGSLIEKRYPEIKDWERMGLISSCEVTMEGPEEKNDA